jgi:hypothetical protein
MLGWEPLKKDGLWQRMKEWLLGKQEERAAHAEAMRQTVRRINEDGRAREAAEDNDDGTWKGPPSHRIRDRDTREVGEPGCLYYDPAPMQWKVWMRDGDLRLFEWNDPQTAWQCVTAEREALMRDISPRHANAVTVQVRADDQARALAGPLSDMLDGELRRYLTSRARTMQGTPQEPADQSRAPNILAERKRSIDLGD